MSADRSLQFVARTSVTSTQGDSPMRSRSIGRVRLISALAITTLLLSALPALATSTADFDPNAFGAEGTVPGQILVTTQPGAASLSSAAGLDDAQVKRVGERIQVINADAGTEAEVAAALAAQSEVLTVSPSYYHEAHEVPDDELYELEWAHQRTNAEAGWDIATGSGDVSITIIDTGINSDHPDLSDRIGVQLRAEGGDIVDGTDGDNDSTGDGHGTLVAGVAGASTNNGIGVAGVDWAATLNDIDVFQIIDGEVRATDADVLAAVVWAAENDQDAANLSLGRPLGPEEDGCPAAFQAAVDQANDAGTTVVAASGNAGPDTEQLPGICEGVISVGATDHEDNVASYSTTNEFVDLSAPGGDFDPDNPPAELTDELILSTRNTESVNPPVFSDEYDVTLGTSFASPYVAGVVGLLKSVDAGLSPAEIADILRDTAVHPEGEDRTDGYGHGIVDVAAALEAVVPEPRDERRIYGADIESTDVIGQAIAASQDRFGDGEAEWAVVTRDNEYADALSGSTLTAGVAPVLYTGSEGGLSDDSAAELQRVLAEGGLVAVLGGMDAVPAEVDEDLEALGFEAQRIFGPSRGETAEEVAYFLHEMEEVDGVVLAKAFDWPDAVTAGSIGVQYGYPVLLTGYGEDQVDELHPSAARALEEIDPDVLITVGGTSAIGEDAEREAADIGDVPEENIIRLGGGSRLETAIEVGEFIVDNADEDQSLTAFGANVRNPNGWAHILSTSANLLGTDTAPDGDASGGFYVPFEGDDGSRYTDDDTEFVRDWVRTLDDNGLIVGGRDVITDDAADAFFDDLAADDDDDDDDDGDDDE